MAQLTDSLPEALAAVGALLAAEGDQVMIVVVGGASLNLLGLVERTTQDVDVIAPASSATARDALIPPDPLPPALVRAIARVARDFSLPEDWLNTTVAMQWSQDGAATMASAWGWPAGAR
jgi:hypothetical protein